MKTTKTGLILGKFAPLHKGHQLLIETAIRQMNKVILLIYDCPDTISIPLDIRAGWIKKLYPNIKVIEGWNGPSQSGRKAWIMRLQEDYVRSVVKEKITHFYSSEWYGGHMSKSLDAKNIVVDRQRNKYPVSGTKIRKDPLKYKKFVDPIVYKDLIASIVFLGAESTGKTTIAQALAGEYRTAWMPEYGREYWYKNQKDGKLTPAQLFDLAQEHVKREDELLPRANKFFFVDTNAITTYMFSCFYHGGADKRLVDLARLAAERYDYVFVCDIDIPYEDDGSRSGEAHRIKFQKDIIRDLHDRKLKFYLLRGSLDERIKKVKTIIKAKI